MMKKILVVILIIFSPFSIFAHKLNIFAYYEDGKINVESFFSDGTPCKNCEIEIFSDNNSLIFSGNLDKKGEITINKKLNQNIKIKVKASMGHESVFYLKVKKSKKTKIIANNKPKIAIKQIDQKNLLQQIRIIVREELEKQLKPIILQIAKIQGNLTEKIVSAIGYIFGIFGLIVILKKGR